MIIYRHPEKGYIIIFSYNREIVHVFRSKYYRKYNGIGHSDFKVVTKIYDNL